MLAVLADAPGHGYELSQRLTQRSGGELGVHEGSLYPALHRLERGGLVESAWSSGEGRRRRIYRLTPAGRRAASEARQEWRAFSPAVDRVLGEHGVRTVERYVTELGAALHVRGAVRRRFLRECRDHLADAAAERGEEAAVRAFGPAAEIAAAFDAEIASRRGVRSTFATAAGVLATGGSTLALIHASSPGATRPCGGRSPSSSLRSLPPWQRGLALVQALVLRRSTMAAADVTLLARRNGCALVAAGVTMFSAGAAVPGRGSAVLLLAGPVLVCVALVAVLRARTLARRLEGAGAPAVRPPLEDLGRLIRLPVPVARRPHAAPGRHVPRRRGGVRPRPRRARARRRRSSPRGSRRWRSSDASSCSARRSACGNAESCRRPSGVASAHVDHRRAPSTDLDAFCTRYLAAWNEHDADARRGERRGRRSGRTPRSRPRRAGAGPCRRSARGGAAFPDLRFDETDQPHRTAAGDQVAWRWRMRGTNTGPLDPPGFAPTGRTIEVEGVDLWTMRDGRIAVYRAFYDMNDLARQLAIAPAPGSRAERAMVRAAAPAGADAQPARMTEPDFDAVVVGASVAGCTAARPVRAARRARGARRAPAGPRRLQDGLHALHPAQRDADDREAGAGGAHRGARRRAQLDRSVDALRRLDPPSRTTRRTATTSRARSSIRSCAA